MNTSATLLAVGADGASVMSGCYQGVGASLARQYPWLIYIHCAAHRLNPIVATHPSKVIAAKEVMEACKALHQGFNVAKHKQIFRECRKDYYLKEPLRAVSSLTEKFEGVNTTHQLAAGLYHKMRSHRCISSLCFLHRVLAIMNELRKAMQESSIKWIAISGELLALRQLLQDLKIHPHDMLDAVKTLCSSVGIPTIFKDSIHIQRETPEDPASQIQF